MTDNSTSIPTVGDDEIGSSEDREVRPLSSTINPSPQHGGGVSIWAARRRLERHDPPHDPPLNSPFPNTTY
jgi:hypothetical protein